VEAEWDRALGQKAFLQRGHGVAHNTVVCVFLLEKPLLAPPFFPPSTLENFKCCLPDPQSES
jgi:hypothetical protein